MTRDGGPTGKIRSDEIRCSFIRYFDMLVLVGVADLELQLRSCFHQVPFLIIALRADLDTFSRKSLHNNKNHLKSQTSECQNRTMSPKYMFRCPTKSFELKGYRTTYFSCWIQNQDEPRRNEQLLSCSNSKVTSNIFLVFNPKSGQTTEK